MNHYVRQARLDLGLITGTPHEAICGRTVPVRLRIGSSGRADDPSAVLCPLCEVLHDHSMATTEKEAIA